jgi:hypothetical protein
MLYIFLYNYERIYWLQAKYNIVILYSFDLTLISNYFEPKYKLFSCHHFFLCVYFSSGEKKKSIIYATKI